MSVQPDPLDSVMRCDVPRLRAELRRSPASARRAIEAAAAKLAARAAAIPSIDYPADLPITSHLDAVREALQGSQVVVVAGETGSGKTTQLPKLCLELGYGRRGMIGHTQPRRIAARAVASRVAEELRVELGGRVGYAVRFNDATSDATLIKVVTDGLLLTEIRHDRDLLRYDVVIVDEAHERSLNVDFLLGFLKTLLPRRPDLKLVITSATIDVEKFSRHFGDAPVVVVGGRGFPVEVAYREPEESDDEARDPTLDCIREIEARPRGRAGDVLVFLPGEREILETSRRLRRALGERWEVLPLYARLPTRDQERIFAPGTRRRIVLATNVAETSLTVPNIGYVIDSGLARVSRYSFRSKLQRLPIERVSRASAEQRKGRCGRIAPGLCYRLYSEADHLAQSEFTDPEILRTNLASVVLQMKAFGLGDAATFPFVDRPDPRALKDADTLLNELGALEDGELTRDGRAMARLPVDPRLARMLCEAARRGALAEMLIISSGLATNDPRERPLEHRAAADAAHAAFAEPKSDFAAYLKMWAWHERARAELSSSAFKRACRERFLSAQRLREWRDVHRQLLLATRELGWSVRREPSSAEAIHLSVLAGSASLVGMKGERGEYLGARGLKFRIFPGSALANAEPRWLVASEIAETQRVYARCVAAVDPRWIEAAAQHLLKRTYDEPRWDPKRGEVVASERATLYGLPVVERRTVSFKRIDPAQCRERLIRDALIAGDVERKPPFLEHNLALVRSVAEIESRLRRRGVLVDDERLLDFYSERLPADVVDWRSLDRARAEIGDERLSMSREDVVAHDDVDMSGFPSTVELGGATFDLSYAFAPGAIDDGVSLQVPLGMLAHVAREPLEWLVPGLLAQKCEALVRSLPKSLRRSLAPIPEKADALARALALPGVYRHGRLAAALGARIEGAYGAIIPGDAWQIERIDDHLRMNVQVRDGQGQLVAQGRDLDVLREGLEQRVSEQLREPVRKRIEQQGLERFPDDGVPGHLVIGSRADQVVVYPALADVDGRVDLVMTRSPTEQAQTSRRGYVRLVLNADMSASRRMAKRVRENRRMGLHYAALGSSERLIDEILHAGVWYCFFEDGGLPQTASAFAARLAERRSRWFEVFETALAASDRILARRFDVVRALAEARSPAFAAAVADMREQVDRLVGAEFLRHIELARLSDVPRYLDGVLARLEGLQGRVDKDAEAMRAIRAFEARSVAIAAAAPGDAGTREIRFAIEELRIATFAQRLGTREKVSTQRIERLLDAAEARAGLR